MTKADTSYSRPDAASDSGLLVAATVRDGILSGYVVDPRDRSRRHVLELLVDGLPVALARADRFDARVPTGAHELRDYGYAFDLQRLPPCRFETLEVRVANADTRVARLDAPIRDDARSAWPTPGTVRWNGHLRFAGWLREGEDGAAAVEAILDDAVIARAEIHGARLVEDEEISRSRPAFEFHLPPRFADGRVRTIVVRDVEGRELEGSPVRFVAFADGLDEFLRRYGEVEAEEIHGTLRDRLFPRSAPFDAIETWRNRYEPLTRPSLALQTALLLLGEEEAGRSMAGFGPDGDLTIGVLPSGTRCGRFDPNELAEMLDHSGEVRVFVFAVAGTLFSPGAIPALTEMLRSGDGVSLAYCDLLLSDGTSLAFGAFDYERLLEQGYAAWIFAATADIVRSGIAAGADSLASLFLHGVEAASPGAVPVHVPGFLASLPCPPVHDATAVLRSAVLAHLSRTKRRADVRSIHPGRSLPALRVQRLVSAETVGVVIVTRDEADRLRTCIGRLAEQDTRHRLDIVVVDRGSGRADHLRLLHDLGKRFKVHRLPGTANVAQALNRGAAELRTRLLLLVDASAEAQPDMVEELVARCAEDRVAACGATAVSRSALLQSMGLVLDYTCGARPALFGNGIAEPGFADMALVAQRRSALGTLCLLVKKADLDAVGGFDEAAFGNYLLGADLGLKLGARGRHLLVSPFARVLASRPDPLATTDDMPALEAAGLRRERDLLRQRWGARLDVDPFYSPLLALNGDLFSALACPPRVMRDEPPLAAGSGDGADPTPLIQDERVLDHG